MTIAQPLVEPAVFAAHPFQRELLDGHLARAPTQSEKELVQAETVSFPFAALILILVFSSLVAAGMPLLVAALAIPTTLGGVFLAAQITELSIYVQNVATMLGLALAIDYSLFMVSRFREELRKGRDTGTAVAVTVATSGKAVTFSHKRNNRRWNPNVQRVRALVDGTPRRVNACTSCIKAGKVTRIPRSA